MIWITRKFSYVDYGPYMDKLEKLMMVNAQNYSQFIMVSTDTSDVGVSNYFIGLPSAAFVEPFDGFSGIDERDLPKEVNTILIADSNTPEFKSRFVFKRAA